MKAKGVGDVGESTGRALRFTVTEARLVLSRNQFHWLLEKAEKKNPIIRELDRKLEWREKADREGESRHEGESMQNLRTEGY